MRYEFIPVIVLTIFNIGILAYWSIIWVRSYRNHKDTVSIIVLLFIVQSLINELWLSLAAIHATRGLSMWNITVIGSTVNRVTITYLLGTIHFLVRKIQKDNDKKDDNHGR